MNITLGSGNQDFAILRNGPQNDTITDFKSTYFTASLTGAQETPPRVTSATGTAVGVLNFDQTRFAFTVTTTGIDIDGAQTPGTALDNMSGFHIHKAPAGTPGGIVHNPDLDGEFATNAAAGTLSGGWDTAEGLSGDNLAQLLANGTYFNVHTSQFPGGEIRGQIIKADSGLDQIDLTGLNIGSFATLQAITADISGSASILARFNGVSSRVTLTGVGEAQLAAGDFIFAGAVDDTIAGTSGIDDLFGAGGNDTITGGAGADRLFGEDGNDLFIADGASADRYFGGAGADTVSYSGVGAAIINLQTLVHGGSAAGDTFSAIDRFQGSNTGGDTMTGGSARATFSGLGGDDSLTGGSAADRLTGGLGADTQAGGGGNDVFDFDSIADSTLAPAGQDIISDFNEAAADKIDLLTIDANAVAAGNNAFTFIGSGSFTALGQVRFFQFEGDTWIEANTTGTNAADMLIRLAGLHVLDAADFVL